MFVSFDCELSSCFFWFPDLFSWRKENGVLRGVILLSTIVLLIGAGFNLLVVPFICGVLEDFFSPGVEGKVL